jgi:hypothetical protein
MNVFWNLRPNSSGLWQIVSEQFTRPATSVSSGASSKINPDNRNLLNGIKQMNENPDTKAFVDQFKKIREQQQH